MQFMVSKGEGEKHKTPCPSTNLPIGENERRGISRNRKPIRRMGNPPPFNSDAGGESINQRTSIRRKRRMPRPARAKESRNTTVVTAGTVYQPSLLWAGPLPSPFRLGTCTPASTLTSGRRNEASRDNLYPSMKRTK